VPELYPAIDLRGGRCVRLYQGDFDRETVYGADPVDQARRFADEGASWIHVVDLDAARTGEPVNRPVIAAIAGAVEVPVQTGGGVRDLGAAKSMADAGVARVVVGTAAVEDPRLVARMVPMVAVAVGLDVRGREVSLRGWEQGAGTDVADLLPTFEGEGASAAVVTQIDVDGTGFGPDLDVYTELLAVSTLPLVASGGVGTLDHLRALADLEVAGRRLHGVIVGRALYEGAFTLAEALSAVS
jgi:phosphoribosylformimino-5-aminoimidazole carboxamide ribotide isomerase